MVAVDTVGLLAVSVLGGGRHAGSRGHVPHGSGGYGGAKAGDVGERAAGDGGVGRDSLRREEKRCHGAADISILHGEDEGEGEGVRL